MDKRQQFGNRFLTDPEKVFEHNAWDNVEWDETQEADARKKVNANSEQLVEPEKQELYENEANRFWDEFYSIHQNRFFKDRHWLFTEFPELLGRKKPINSSQRACIDPFGHSAKSGQSSVVETAIGSFNASGDTDIEVSVNSDKLTVNSKKKQESVSTDESLGEHATTSNAIASGETGNTPGSQSDNPEHTVTKVTLSSNTIKDSKDCMASDNNGRKSTEDSALLSYPGSNSTFRIFEVGCGVGNTVFPVLQTNNDQNLFVYCCDLSETAIQLVKENAEYQSGRCHGFVCDITQDVFPFPEESLDVITLIFVLSAVHPDKMQHTITRLSRHLKPGGSILFRDYGRYDMAQLRFKNGRCLSDNFYVRGDGTRVYFFTQEELQKMFTEAGLVEDQNIVDRRLQVNRGRQLKMYRVWIQCKYRKPNRDQQN